MSIISESNADVFAAAFTDSDAMPGVEAATYKQHGNTNTISVNLQVNRHVIDEPPEAGRGRNFNITAFMGANTNITTINTAGDLITLASTQGATAADLSVVEVLNQSPAGWLLLLR